MVAFTTTRKSHKITLYSSDEVNVNDVYNRMFFSSFGLNNFRIHKHGSTISADEGTEETNAFSFENIFGKEQQPNGYSILPLQSGDFRKQDALDITDEYVNKFKNVKAMNVPSETPFIDIYFPLETSLLPFEPKEESGDFIVGTSAMTYSELSHFIFDLYSQIIYFLEQGFYFQEIHSSSIMVIEGKHIIFDMETLNSGKNDSELQKKTCEMFLHFIYELMGKRSIPLIKGTPLERFVKRIENERVLLWIHTL